MVALPCLLLIETLNATSLTQELERSDLATLRNNIMIALADFYVRYTAMVDWWAYISIGWLLYLLCPSKILLLCFFQVDLHLLAYTVT